MKRTASNILYHELIGLRVCILKHSDPTLVGLKGIVIDETANTLVVKSDDGRIRRIPKLYAIFRFYLKDLIVDVDGTRILGRPEDRLKKIR